MDNKTAFIIRRLVKGQSRESVVIELVDLGMSESDAKELVSKNARSIMSFTADEQKARIRSDGKGQALWGAMCVAIGLAVTFATFAMATSGGVYIITIGLIIGGAIMCIKGLIKMA